MRWWRRRPSQWTRVQRLHALRPDGAASLCGIRSRQLAERVECGDSTPPAACRSCVAALASDEKLAPWRAP